MRFSLPGLGAAVAAVILVVAAGPGICDGKSADQAYVDAVLDGLVRSGVLTLQQANQIKEDAQTAADRVAAAAKPSKPAWYDTTKVSGYGQVRYLFNPDQDDPDNEFLVRRARIKVAGEPVDRTKVQLQLDMGDGEVTVKDAWLQYEVSQDGEWTLRAGQQKIPFGFETPQSSSKRLPFERNWVARRVVAGERDTGVVLYWTDPDDEAMFADAKKHHLGTGDYGTVAVGVYNGQGINAAEVNDQKHITARFSKPFTCLGGRYAEAGASYYGGTFNSSAGGVDFHEHLWGAHVYLPPQPVGVQAELYDGRTEGASVDGFYALGMWRPNDDGIAFVRYDEYNGPRKGKGLGNVYDRERWSFGYAHQVNSNTEVTLEFDTNDVAGGGTDDMFGVQLQMGY